MIQASRWNDHYQKYHDGGKPRLLVQDLKDRPTRLIQLTYDTPTESPELKLVTQGDIALYERYATLSHCWGQ
jgi:hypothetical protein